MAMMSELPRDPLLDALGALPRLSSPVRRDARIRLRCHAALAGRRRAAGPDAGGVVALDSTHAGGVARRQGMTLRARVTAAALVLVACGYGVAVVREAVRLARQLQG
jgi:hypothetical protein